MPQLSLSRQTLWQAGARVAAFALSLALPLFLTRHLSKSDFGLYKQAFLLVASAITLLPFGFYMSAFYFLAREPEKKKTFILNILIVQSSVAIAGALLLIVFPQPIASFLRNPELTAYEPRIALIIFLWTVSCSLDTIAQANQEPRMASVVIAAIQFSRAALLLGAAVSFGTVNAMVNAAIAQGVIQTVVLVFYLQSRFPAFWKCFEWNTFRRQMSYALPFSAAGLLFYIQLDLHNYVVSHEFSSVLFAVYSNGCFDVPLVAIISDSISSVLIPRISALQKTGSYEEIVRLTCAAIHKLALVFFPLYVYLLTVGSDLIVMLFSERYRQSGPVFLVNITLLPFLILLMEPIMRAYAEYRHFQLRLNLVLIILQVPLLLLCIRYLGLIGAIAAVVATNIAGRIAVAWRAATALHVRRDQLRQLDSLPRIALASIAAGIAGWLLKAALGPVPSWQIVACCGVLFAPLYLAALFAVGALRAEEKDYMNITFRRMRGYLGAAAR